MMSQKEWQSHIMNAARDISNRDFQERAWLQSGKVVSTPEEIFLVLMEDYMFDSFLQTYGETLTAEQLQAATSLRTRLVSYYEKMPKHPDPRAVLNDHEWDLVRQSAQKFVQVFESQTSRRNE
jgi:hypothetical protein